MATSVFEQLIEESAGLEKEASAVQGETDLRVGDDAIDGLVAHYHEWYARALDALPDEFEERFRDEFESGIFKGHKIEDFLKGPGDVNPLYNQEEPNPLLTYWLYPLDAAFKSPLLAQRQILAEARQRLEGPGESSQHLLLIERLCRNLPEFLEPFKNRREGRTSFIVEDEYDLQTVIHAGRVPRLL
jgi:hypothetical protein